MSVVPEAAPARLRNAFSQPEPARGALPEGASAVLLPVLARPEGVAVVFTRRAAHLAMHPGEISFPGGRIQPGEAPLAAALREVREEVGLAPGDVDVLGHLADLVTHYGRLVCAYVGVVRSAGIPALPAGQDEVKDVFAVGAERLLAPGPYEARRLAGAGGERVVHYWHLPEATVWGITGELLARFLERAFGWGPPRAPRVVGSVSGLRP